MACITAGPLDGGGSNTSRALFMRFGPGQVTEVGTQRPMRIDDAQAVQVQRHLLGVGVHRRDVEPHGRLIATAGEEQVADLRRALELRQIAPA